jgi:hypothetical protein
VREHAELLHHVELPQLARRAGAALQRRDVEADDLAAARRVPEAVALDSGLAQMPWNGQSLTRPAGELGRCSAARGTCRSSRRTPPARRRPCRTAARTWPRCSCRPRRCRRRRSCCRSSGCRAGPPT